MANDICNVNKTAFPVLHLVVPRVAVENESGRRLLLTEAGTRILDLETLCSLRCHDGYEVFTSIEPPQLHTTQPPTLIRQDSQSLALLTIDCGRVSSSVPQIASISFCRSATRCRQLLPLLSIRRSARNSKDTKPQQGIPAPSCYPYTMAPILNETPQELARDPLDVASPMHEPSVSVKQSGENSGANVTKRCAGTGQNSPSEEDISQTCLTQLTRRA